MPEHFPWFHILRRIHIDDELLFQRIFEVKERGYSNAYMPAEIAKADSRANWEDQPKKG